MWRHRLLLFIFCLGLPVGGFAYSWGKLDFTSSATLNESYDDNITYASKHALSDAITQVALGLMGSYGGKTEGFSFGGDLRYDVFARYSNFDNLSEHLAGMAQKELNDHNRVSFRDDFTHAQEPRSFEDQFGRTGGRYSYYADSAGIVYAHDFTQQLSADLHYNYAFTIYSRDDISDSYLNKVGTAWQYVFDAETIALFSYDYSLRNFDPGLSAYVHTVAVGARRYLTSQLYLEGDSGVDVFETYAKHSYVKPLFTVALNDVVDSVTVAGITFTREYSPNAYFEDILNSWRVAGNISHSFFPRFTAAGSLFWGRGTYITTRVKDELTGIDVNATYDLGHNTQVFVDNNYSQTRSNVASRAYTRNRVSLGIKVSFG